MSRVSSTSAGVREELLGADRDGRAPPPRRTGARPSSPGCRWPWPRCRAYSGTPRATSSSTHALPQPPARHPQRPPAGSAPPPAAARARRAAAARARRGGRDRRPRRRRGRGARGGPARRSSDRPRRSSPPHSAATATPRRRRRPARARRPAAPGRPGRRRRPRRPRRAPRARAGRAPRPDRWRAARTPEPTGTRGRPAHAVARACRRRAPSSRRRRRRRRSRSRVDAAVAQAVGRAREGERRLLGRARGSGRAGPRPRGRRRRTDLVAVAAQRSQRGRRTHADPLGAVLARPGRPGRRPRRPRRAAARRRRSRRPSRPRAGGRTAARRPASSARRPPSVSATSRRVVFEPMSTQAHRTAAAIMAGDGLRRTGHPRPRAAQGLRRPRGGPRHRLRGRPRRGLRPARPQRRGQDDDGRDPRGLPRAARAASSPCSATIPSSGPRALRERVGIVLQATGMYRHIRVREAVAHWAGALPAARATSTRCSTSPASRQGGRAGADALGRPAAPPGLRAGARRRPRARSSSTSPRPASTRPRGAPRGSAIRALQGARQDRPADDALPRRGAGALRPRGDHQGGADPRRWARPRRSARAPRATASPGATSAAAAPGARGRRPHRAAAPAHERARWPAASALRDLSVTRPTLEDVYLELTADADEPERAVADAVALAWRQYRLERRMFWRNPTRGVLQLRPAAAVPGAVRRDLQRRARRTST